MNIKNIGLLAMLVALMRPVADERTPFPEPSVVAQPDDPCPWHEQEILHDEYRNTPHVPRIPSCEELINHGRETKFVFDATGYPSVHGHDHWATPTGLLWIGMNALLEDPPPGPLPPPGGTYYPNLGDSWDDVDVSSGYRCPVGNAAVPDASPTSLHMYGKAMDFSAFSDPGWGKKRTEIVRNHKKVPLGASDAKLTGDISVHIEW